MRSKAVNSIICSALSMAMAVSLTACGGGNGGKDDTADNGMHNNVEQKNDAADLSGNVGDTGTSGIAGVGGNTDEKVTVDDFYMYVNEEWINNNQLWEDEYEISNLDYNTNELYDRLIEIMGNAKPEDFAENDPMRKMTELYSQFSDKDKREIEAMADIRAMTDYVRSIKNVNQLQNLMNDDTYMLFNNVCSITMEMSTALTYVPEFNPKSILELRGEVTDKQREIMTERIAKTFEILGYSENEARKISENANTFDEWIHEYYAEGSGYMSAYNENTWENTACAIDLHRILKSHNYIMTDKVGLTEYGCFADEDYISWLNKYITDANIEVIRDFYAYCVVEELCLCGSRELVAANSAIVDCLMGAKASEAEDIYDYSEPIAMILYYDEGVIADYYSSVYITEEMKAETLEMTKDIVAEYKEYIGGVDWLNTVQKERLKTKAGLITYQLGSYNDFNRLEDMVVEEKLVDTVLSLKKSNRHYQQRMLVEHADPKENVYTDTHLNLYQTNAYFDFESNSIIVTPGFFADDYIWTDAGYEERMATLGFVMAHEIAHTFDPSNVGYKRSAEYDDRWDSFWEQYDFSALKVLDYYDGMQTDFGGTIIGNRVILEGYTDILAMTVVTNVLEKHENADFDLFFRNFAATWASVSRIEAAEFFLEEDGHLPNHERVNSVLAQNDRFYETYDVKSDSSWYVDPADRIHIFEYK